MLLVPTYLDKSAIHGIGLFARTFIAAGTVTWRYDDLLDRRLPLEAVLRQPEPVRRTLATYCYPDEEPGSYVWCGDDARFFNHSAEPNTVSRPEGDYATRDIEPGTELTCDYGAFRASPEPIDWAAERARLLGSHSIEQARS